MGGISNLTGYAWSSNIGWLHFNPSGPYPASPAYSAQLNTATNELSGWARFLSNGGGWDGWVKLRSPGYGVSYNSSTCRLEGFAWGGDVVGWISFNGPSYGVYTSFGGCTAPPTGSITGSPPNPTPPPDYRGYPLTPDQLSISYTAHDDNGDLRSCRFEIKNSDGFTVYGPENDCDAPGDPGYNQVDYVRSPFTPALLTSETYTMYLTVEDADPGTSDPPPYTKTFYLLRDLNVNFTITPNVARHCIGCTLTLTPIVTLSETATGYTSWTWGTPSANQETQSDSGSAPPTITRTYATPGTYVITLTVTDNASRTRSRSRVITVANQTLPSWKETTPR